MTMDQHRHRVAAIVFTLHCLPGILATGGASLVRADEPLRFNRDIRPILANHCFACHGPDSAARRGQLRLDRREAALAPAESGDPPIVPGQPEQSPLVARIHADDPDLQMPPPDANKPLSSEQKHLLQQWIAEGAEYEAHWSLLPPQRPTPPAVQHPEQARNEIDAFILARVEREGLQPAPHAELPTLLRRLSLDLTGLPPTPEHVEAFVSEMSAVGAQGSQSDTVYVRWVDRYLDSPHYGERMAVDWLDAARYADTNGYQVDRDRDMHAWRDWVITAFNSNLPFDRFTIEQIAGDLLPEATLSQRIATGFHRNHMLNEEGGIIPEEFLAEYCSDRVETTASVWLGQTLMCARCHDHKFDDFTQRDYYGLYAFFHNVTEKGIGDYGAPYRRSAPPFVQLPAPELEVALENVRQQQAEAQQQLSHLDEQLQAEQAAWEEQLRQQISSAGSGDATDATPVPPEIAAIVAKPTGERTDAEKHQLTARQQTQHPERKAQADKVAELNTQVKNAEGAIPTVMVMQELPEPIDEHPRR